MAVDTIDSVLVESGDTQAQPELLVSAVLHLMSHYNATPDDSSVCIKLASVIERHLKLLAGVPDLGPVLRATCEQLAERWAVVAEREMPQPKSNSLFERLMTAARRG